MERRRPPGSAEGAPLDEARLDELDLTMDPAGAGAEASEDDSLSDTGSDGNVPAGPAQAQRQRHGAAVPMARSTQPPPPAAPAEPPGAHAERAAQQDTALSKPTCRVWGKRPLAEAQAQRARAVNLRLAETFRSGAAAAAPAGHERVVLHADALATAPAELRRAAKRGHADVVGHQ